MSDYTPPWCDECHNYLRSYSFSVGTLVGHTPECRSYGAAREWELYLGLKDKA